MRNGVTVAIGLILLSACKYAQINPSGTKVQPVTQAPAGDCQNLGMVTGKGGGGLGKLVPNEELIDHATNDALNKAGERGATHLVLMAPSLGSTDSGTTTTATISGVAYRCGGGTASPAAGAATTAAAAAPAAAAAQTVSATLRSAAPVRSAPDKSAPSRFELAAGTRVDAAPAATRGFRKIQTADGRSGYVDDALLQVGAQ
jgi:hypothetical protein